MPETRKGIATFGKGPQVTRAFVVTVGEIYRIDPLDPKVAKHRGRLGIVLRFLNSESASVRFMANRKYARFKIGDLVSTGFSVTDPLEAMKQDVAATMKNILRDGLTGPHKNDRRVDELLDKAIHTPPDEVDSPDRPDYLMEAGLHAEGLMHASDAAQMIGDFELELKGVVDNLFQNIIQRIVHDHPKTEAEVKALVREAVEEAKKDMTSVEAQTRRNYGLEN